jgi:hypothetical protein
MEGSPTNTEMFHRLDQRGNAGATCDLRNHPGSLGHFSNYLRRESSLMATANQFAVEDRISFARRKYSSFPA